MKCFLCSSPVLPGTETLNPANGFADALRASVPAHGKTLFVCSDPDDPARTARFAAALKAIFDDAGFDFARFDILERRNEKQAARLVAEADFIVLAGGHVPTQNRFFRQIGLKELLRGFDGVLMGISAGSMNCAETVYAQPEREGEAADAKYQRFLPGLGLTKKSIIPHYQEIRDDVLDGLRVMEDVAYPDSAGRAFYVLPDGSYLLIDGNREQLRGEAYLLADGKLTRITIR